MAFVLTLIAASGKATLGPDLAEAMAGALAEAGALVRPADWLAPGAACDLAFSGLDAATAEGLAAERLAGVAIDLAVLPTRGRRKALLVADLESTIIGQEMLDELADSLGLRDQVSAITARAMAGELDFAAALDQRVGLLKGLPEAALETAAGRMTLTPGARQLVATMAAHGAYTALVSGGFTCFAGPVAEACGFDEVVANRLIIEDGRLSGAAARPLVDREAKLATLERLACERGLGLEAACAVGDGANDRALLGAAGLGVAYHGKPVARAAARARIDHGDLTALLYLQGYRQSEITET